MESKGKYTAKSELRMEKFDGIALDIEFLVISVIQGVALGVLASTALKPLADFRLSALPYIVTAFLFIIIFWTGAIMHAVSFIDWPIDLVHTFLYFLVSLSEIMVISNLGDPLLWFVFMIPFGIFAFALYFYDLKIIQNHKIKFKGPGRMELYGHIISEHKKELFVLLPISFFFNLIIVLLFYLYPFIFIKNNYHLVFIFLQMVFGVVFLIQEAGSFKRRSKMLVGERQIRGGVL